MSAVNPDLAASHGYSSNQNGGLYQRGLPYDVLAKLRVGQKYLELLEQDGRPPHFSRVARETQVGDHFVKKVVKEMLSKEGIRDDSDIERLQYRGIGSKTLDDVDEVALILLLREQPSRTLPDYQRSLLRLTGTAVSSSVISRFFNHALPFKASFRSASIVPYDKYKQNNIQRAIEYADFIARVNPLRLKFGDEKHLKGMELYNRQTRRDPLTGQLYPILVEPDFRNAYNILGICGIDPTDATSMYFKITTETNNAETFSVFIEEAVACGFLKRGDILVIDNAAIHTGKENGVLEDWLWEYIRPNGDGEPLKVYVLFLPTRSPELNPIELLWAILVKRLKTFPMGQFAKDASAHAAAHIMHHFDPMLVASCYAHCNYVGSD
jgi:transposase